MCADTAIAVQTGQTAGDVLCSGSGHYHAFSLCSLRLAIMQWPGGKIQELDSRLLEGSLWP